MFDSRSRSRSWLSMYGYLTVSLVWAASRRTFRRVDAAASSVQTMPLIPHHVQKQRRLHQLQQEHGLRLDEEAFDQQFRRRDEAQQVGALFHGYGTHYADVWVGTPPQRQTVIVDTGSSLTAFPCTGCRDCGAPNYHIDNYFDFDASSTFHKTACGECQRGNCISSGTDSEQCKISMSYQEGSSWYAFEANDITYVGGPHTVALVEDVGNEDIDPRYAKHFSFPMTFGCQYKLTGLFKTQLADGIMGMENAKTSFWKQLYSAGKIQEQKFSLCFSRPREAEREGTEAGAMTFGGTDTRLHKTDMVYTSQPSKKAGFFSVTVRKMYVRHGSGGESAKSIDPAAQLIALDVAESALNSGGVIVDSGTTDTYFTRQISKQFQSAFAQLSGVSFSHSGVRLTPEQLAAYPTIIFQLYGDETANAAINPDPNQVTGLAGDIDPQHPYDVILAIPPSHYMEQDSSGKYTARFYDTESSGSVLGANSIMGHDVMFDADNFRIGWAESDCDYNKLITEGGYMDVMNGAAYQNTGGTPETTEGQGEDIDTTNTDTTDVDVDTTGTEAETIDVDTTGGETANTPEDEQNQDIPPSGDATVPDAQKKGHPSADSSSHDEQSPADDIKKAVHGFADACDSGGCRSGFVLMLLFVLFLGCTCARRSCGSSSNNKNIRYARAELELSDTSFQDNAPYSDDGDDLDDPGDAEYGDFATDRKIT